MSLISYFRWSSAFTLTIEQKNCEMFGTVDICGIVEEITCFLFLSCQKKGTRTRTYIHAGTCQSEFAEKSMIAKLKVPYSVCLSFGRCEL